MLDIPLYWDAPSPNEPNFEKGELPLGTPLSHKSCSLFILLVARGVVGSLGGMLSMPLKPLM